MSFGSLVSDTWRDAGDGGYQVPSVDSSLVTPLAKPVVLMIVVDGSAHFINWIEVEGAHHYTIEKLVVNEWVSAATIPPSSLLEPGTENSYSSSALQTGNFYRLVARSSDGRRSPPSNIVVPQVAP